MIHCFSATGNSRLVADMLGAEIAESRQNVVWVFPIHAWGVPGRVLSDIARAADIPSGASHWMVATCGDDIGYADLQWREAVTARGWHAAGAWSVLMPDTYICLPGFTVDSPDEQAGKLSRLPARVEAIRRAIHNGNEITDVRRGAFPKLKSGAIRRFFERHLMSPSRFRVGKRCNGCSRCVSVCPQANIRLGCDRRPVYGDDCTMCLACLHACPQTAIEWGPFTKGKQRYKRIDNI